MSIDDDRTPAAGGSTDSGYFTPSEQRYTAYDSDDTTDTTDFDDEVVATREPHKWHFGADLGLLVLRVALGAMLVGHGLQKVFGIMQGPGIDGFAKFLGTLGYQQTTLLAWVTGVTELTAGSLLVLGLFTPAAAAAALGVMANAIWVKLDLKEFLGAVELESLYAAGAFALLFAGAGKISLDRNTPWFRRAPAFGFVFLVLAIGLSVATLIVLR